MNRPNNQTAPHVIPLQPIGQVARGTVLPLAPPEIRNDAPC